jgi:hypothetical protein
LAAGDLRKTNRAAVHIYFHVRKFQDKLQHISEIFKVPDRVYFQRVGRID